jgi:CRISPR-associated endonuclease/helicase Cas3
LNLLPLLWAKGGDEYPAFFHPVPCHLVDVGQVCLRLWEEVLRDRLKERLARAIGLDVAAAGRWISFWAGAHDLGKVSPGFQAQSPQARATLQAAGLRFPLRPEAVPHGVVSAAVLPGLLSAPEGWPAAPARFARRLAVAVGGHHGVFPRPSERDLGGAALGGPSWSEARRRVLGQLAEALGLRELPAAQEPPEGDHAFFMVLAGLTSVADWIGSAADFFPFAGPGVDLGAYPSDAARGARAALDGLGWTGWKGLGGPRTFGELFPACKEVRPLQQEAARQAARLPGPGLVLIESPMGEGKTEAALLLADNWTHAAGQGGLYVALPTQATSNQMFGRVRAFLAHRYPDEKVNLHLLHGAALLSEQYERLRLAGIYDPPGSGGTVVAESWFTPRKRGLLSPFAVGTVDQALLAVLQTRHVFVRLFGLAGKTVIVDEVHAYDAYTSTLLEHLLAWLAALGASVVLLSATLPRKKRREFLAAFAGRDVALEEVPYPRMITTQGGEAQALHVPAAPERRATIQLRWQDRDLLADDLRRALVDGGCAAVLCNTVGSAQRTYALLRDALGPHNAEVSLFHARFTFECREKIEGAVRRQFGLPLDNPGRPPRAVLVATQVIEQSLDLDFDLMVTEVAPVDLVLQRAGRLHRHRGRPRPAGLLAPQLWLLRPESDNRGVPAFGADEWVYARHILLRSYLALRGRGEVRLPDELEGLVEAVYGDEAPRTPDEAWGKALRKSYRDWERKQQEARAVAAQFVIKPPDYLGELLDDFNRQLEEDDPGLHPTLQAMTRLGEPTVTVVCLYRTPGGLRPAPGDAEAVDPDVVPTPDEARRLLRCALSLSHGGLVQHFRQQAAPPGWRESPLLRRHQLAELDATGAMRAGNFTLRLDRELGAVITREGARGTPEP